MAGKNARELHWDKIDGNEKVKFDSLYNPETITRRVHNHELHMDGKSKIDDLEKKALEFLLYDCRAIDGDENAYTCNRDILSLYHAIHRFMETGSREDAFGVYYCYIDTFIDNYTEARKLIEMLSNFENNASNLVSKHRDHYSHSVYVFVLGLAIYRSNKNIKDNFFKNYIKEQENGEKVEDKVVSINFLRYWGVTALFHDVGYPFEIPFEQIVSYFEVKERDDCADYPFIAYKNIEKYISVRDLLEKAGENLDNQKYNECLRKFLEKNILDDAENYSLGHIIAHHIARRLKDRKYGSWDTERYISGILHDKPAHPEEYNYYMDHAVFSSILVFRRLVEMITLKELFRESKDVENFYGWMDSLTAIVMHNSLFMYSLRKVGTGAVKIPTPLKMEEHPLAYLLMLCDELQCWDRAAFGKESKGEYHAWDCEFSFSKTGGINVTYLFDKNEKALVFGGDDQERSLEGCAKGTLKKLFYREIVNDQTKQEIKVLHPISKSFNPIEGDIKTWKIDGGSTESYKSIFYTDIDKRVELSDLTSNPKESLKVGLRIEVNNRFRNHSLSELRLINIYDFASELYKKIEDPDGSKKLLFEDEPLYVKMSYIQRIKNVADYLDDIGIVYSDRSMALSELHLNDFTMSDVRSICLKESERQLDEKVQMCFAAVTWDYILKYYNDPTVAAAAVREMIKHSKESGNKDAMVQDEVYFEKLELGVIKLLQLLDEKCNLYYLPGKKFTTVVFSDEKKAEIRKKPDKFLEFEPDLVLEKDLKGNVLKKYNKDAFWFDRVMDEIQPVTRKEIRCLYLVMIKEFYTELKGEYDDQGSGVHVMYFENPDDSDKKLKPKYKLYVRKALKNEKEVLDKDGRPIYVTDLCRIDYEKNKKGEIEENITYIDRTRYHIDHLKVVDAENVDIFEVEGLYLRYSDEGYTEILSELLDALKEDKDKKDGKGKGKGYCNIVLGSSKKAPKKNTKKKTTQKG